MSLEASDIIFRTADPTKWGGGKAANLNATEVDLNFWKLLEAVINIQENPPAPIQIQKIEVEDNAILFTMNDASTFGPIPLPLSSIEFLEAGWEPNTSYLAGNMFVGPDDVTYFVARPITSGEEFDPDISDVEGTCFKPLGGGEDDGGGNGGDSNEYFHFNIPGSIAEATVTPYSEIASFIVAKPVVLASFNGCFARTRGVTFQQEVYCSVNAGASRVGRITWQANTAAGVFTWEADDPENLSPGDVVSIGAPLKVSDDEPPVGSAASGLVGVITLTPPAA